ncbi:hypothetical protein [Parasutterella muris]|uniref:Uncharacterized protein n=2 Tax=Parasutterella TaxID=577310 RepID=A0A6L6YFZ2_9BURK|nr:hypothetical protein [Parasutterella muris]MVX55608.1 hypothetical protein [Parasutterella muris]
MAKEISDVSAGGYAPRRGSVSVPKYDGFHVRENQWGYNPVSLNIPIAEESKFHGLLDKASARFDHMVAKVQAEQDDARVTAAITDLRRHATDLEAGENGWRKLLQANALEPDDQGRGLVERVDADMRSYGDKIGEKLTGRQRAAFNRHAMNVYQSVYGGVSSHVANQGMEYQKGVYTSAIDYEVEAASVNGYKPDLLADGESRLTENVDKLASLLGIPQDQRENFRRKYTSNLYANAIDGVMSNAGPNPSVGFQALGLLQKHSSKMLGSDVNRLRRTIDVAVKEAKAQITEDKFKAEHSGYTLMQNGGEVRRILSEQGVSIPANTGDAAALEDFTVGVIHGLGKLQTDTSEVTHDGKKFSARSRYGASNVSLENAYELDKNVDPKRLLDDKAYNIGMGVKVYKDHLRQFAGDKQAAFAAYYSSPREVKAAQKEAEEDTEGASWFDRLPKNVQEKVAQSMHALEAYSSTGAKGADGKSVNSFTPAAFRAQPTWMTPNQIEQWLLEKDPRARTDPSYRHFVFGRLVAEQNREQAEFKQRQENLLAYVTDTMYANGGDPSSVDPRAWAQLTRKQQTDALAIAEKLQRGEDTTDPAVASLYANDDQLRAVSLDGLKMLRPHYSERDFAVLQTRWFKVQSEGRTAQEKQELARRAGIQGQVLPEFVPASSKVKQAMLAVPTLAKLKDKDKDGTSFNNAAQTFMSAIAIEGQISGTAITDELGVMKAVGRMTNGLGGADPGKLVMLFGTKASTLPDEGLTDVRDISKTIAKDRYGHEPSDLEIMNVAREIVMNRSPNVDVSKIVFDEAFAQKVRKDFREIKGRDPVGAEFLRAYFLARCSSETADRQEGFSVIRDEGY